MTWKKYPCFKELTTEQDFVDYLFSLYGKFEETYQVYQELLYSFQNNNVQVLESNLNINLIIFLNMWCHLLKH